MSRAVRILSLCCVAACSGEGCELDSDSGDTDIIDPPIVCPDGMNEASGASVTVFEYTTNGAAQTIGFNINAQGDDGEAAACISSDGKTSRVMLVRFDDEPFTYFTHTVDAVAQHDLQATGDNDPQLFIDQVGTTVAPVFVNGDWTTGIWETRELSNQGVWWELTNGNAVSSDGNNARLGIKVSVQVDR